MRILQGAALAAAAVITLAGCAAVERQQAADAEKLLQEAGFHQVPADTPAREQDLKDLSPRQLFARTRDGQTGYVFSDPYNCACFYVGGQKEYAQLQQLRKASIAEHNRLVAQDASDRSLNGDLWGPWNPQGLIAK
jgi:uncharacterized protein YdbL (DUF1318 family)